ncbi:MAG: cytochrome c-type biogenesis protein CcmH [Actinomycetota bacterium]|nr:cytochrome c-type biogenesis protein CcmH [Actinomycetota bacterium]
MTRRKLAVWTAFGAVLVAALVIGSGVFSPGKETAAQRAAAIGSVLKCPSCEDLSVADSSAPTAVTARAEIRKMIAEGLTNQQIEAALVARYGTAIELLPPASGWGLLIWLVPAGSGAIALLALGVMLERRRGAVTVAGPGGAEDVPPGPGGAARSPGVASAPRRRSLRARSGARGSPVTPRGTLAEQATFLRASLADAEAEHEAGDLSDGDYQALVARDTRRLEAVEARLAADDTVLDSAAADEPVLDPAAVGEPDSAGPDTAAVPARPSRRPRTRRQKVLVGGASLSFGGAIVLAVVLGSGTRLPGDTLSGNIVLSKQQTITRLLAQAATAENEGKVSQAVQVYQAVLARSPKNEQALAQLGWIEFEAGSSANQASLVKSGRSMVTEAVSLNPGDYAAHLYLGTILYLENHEAAAAVAQYAQFLADDPPTTVVDQAASTIRQVYQAAGAPLPASVPRS